MPYTDINFKSGAEFKRAFKAGDTITVHQPGPFGPNVTDGTHCFEGPHYPEPHHWYVQATVKDGVVVSIKGVKPCTS